MNKKWDIPFNLFTWSVLLVVFYGLIQTIVVTTVTFSGFSYFAPMALLNWLAVSAAISYALVSRYKPELFHLLLLQTVASFYMCLILGAYVLRGGAPFDAAFLLQLLGILAVLLASGSIGIVLARTLKGRFST